ncbi:FAD-dependent oxidoreductase [Halorientalis litorea]|uniref:FAD-dependent oxidoreductase n=1 Tax=Halorientalis litorea TaxID=2931977 RepID=UPI001FF3CE4D|nr:hypothetical protein [Halorientalis litorea]
MLAYGYADTEACVVGRKPPFAGDRLPSPVGERMTRVPTDCDSLRHDGGRHGRADRTVPDHRHDRQVLVVGDDLTAATAAGFLEQAGLDPVLVPPSNAGTHSATVTLWHSGLVLLERLGLRRPVERLGTRLDRLNCPSAGSSWAGERTDVPTLLAVRRDSLRNLLDRRVRDRVRTVQRPVIGVTPTAAGVDVTFDHGLEESFDAVVTTDPRLLPVAGTRPGSTTVHVWEFDWPTTVPAPSSPTEAWGHDHAAFSVPAGDGAHVRLVSVAEQTRATPVDVEALDAQFGDRFESGSFGNPLTALDRHALQYRQFPHAVPVSIRADGVALAGPSTRSSLPGDCLGTALGVEDAWVLADTLAYGPSERAAALAAYETRRRRRQTELTRHAMDQLPLARTPARLSPRLSRLCATRALAFRHVTGEPTPDFAHAVPDSL